MHIRIVDNARTCALRNLLIVRLCVPTTASGSKVFLCYVITLTTWQYRRASRIFYSSCAGKISVGSQGRYRLSESTGEQSTEWIDDHAFHCKYRSGKRHVSAIWRIRTSLSLACVCTTWYRELEALPVGLSETLSDGQFDGHCGGHDDGQSERVSVTYKSSAQCCHFNGLTLHKVSIWNGTCEIVSAGHELVPAVMKISGARVLEFTIRVLLFYACHLGIDRTTSDYRGHCYKCIDYFFIHNCMNLHQFGTYLGKNLNWYESFVLMAKVS